MDRCDGSAVSAGGHYVPANERDCRRLLAAAHTGHCRGGHERLPHPEYRHDPGGRANGDHRHDESRRRHARRDHARLSVSVGIYSTLATLPAIVLGLFVGYELGSFLAASVPIDIGPFVLQWWIVGVGLAVGFGVPFLAALLPLWNGTRISVRDALAGYGVSAGSGNGVLARLGRA